jgi:hypothetical protein
VQVTLLSEASDAPMRSAKTIARAGSRRQPTPMAPMPGPARRVPGSLRPVLPGGAVSRPSWRWPGGGRRPPGVLRATGWYARSIACRPTTAARACRRGRCTTLEVVLTAAARWPCIRSCRSSPLRGSPAALPRVRMPLWHRGCTGCADLTRSRYLAVSGAPRYSASWVAKMSEWERLRAAQVARRRYKRFRRGGCDG